MTQPFDPPITSPRDPRFKPFLTANFHQPGQHTLHGYESRGGYQALRKALAMSPEEIVEEVKESGIRGRGGAGFPTGLKWSFMPRDDRPKVILGNADESEPGTANNRWLMELDPFLVIEGMTIGAIAMRAEWGYIYLRAEYTLAAERLQNAIREAERANLLGENILGSGKAFRLAVHRGAGAYICGEETALMSSLEGWRGQPRMRPPFPAQSGLWRWPTTINNVESFACVVPVINHGAKWYASFGTERSKGTKIITVSGPVRRPGNYEVPFGTTFRELLEDLAGGPVDGVKWKALVPGGASAPLLRWSEAQDLTFDYESIAGAGSMLGSGAVVPIAEDKCIVDVMWNIVRFFGHESCGKCTPCREGIAGWMVRLFEKLETGRGEPGDVEKIHELAVGIEGRAFCLLADACTAPVRSAIRLFRDEFDHHVAHGACLVRPRRAPARGREAVRG